MIHLFIPYRLAIIAREKGFHEPCLAIYDSERDNRILMCGQRFDEEIETTDNFKDGFKEADTVAPMYQQMIDWFRNNHNIHIEIYEGHDEDKIWWNAELKRIELGYNYEPINKEDIVEDSYYETLSKAIEEAFKLI